MTMRVLTQEIMKKENLYYNIRPKLPVLFIIFLLFYPCSAGERLFLDNGLLHLYCDCKKDNQQNRLKRN